MQTKHNTNGVEKSYTVKLLKVITQRGISLKTSY